MHKVPTLAEGMYLLDKKPTGRPQGRLCLDDDS